MTIIPMEVGNRLYITLTDAVHHDSGMDAELWPAIVGGTVNLPKAIHLKYGIDFMCESGWAVHASSKIGGRQAVTFFHRKMPNLLQFQFKYQKAGYVSVDLTGNT